MQRIFLLIALIGSTTMMAQVDPRDFIPAVNNLPTSGGQSMWNSQLSNYGAFYPEIRPALDAIRSYLQQIDAAQNNPAQKASLRSAMANRVRSLDGVATKSNPTEQEKRQLLIRALYNRLLMRLG